MPLKVQSCLRKGLVCGSISVKRSNLTQVCGLHNQGLMVTSTKMCMWMCMCVCAHDCVDVCQPYPPVVLLFLLLCVRGSLEASLSSSFHSLSHSSSVYTSPDWGGRRHRVTLTHTYAKTHMHPQINTHTVYCTDISEKTTYSDATLDAEGSEVTVGLCIPSGPVGVGDRREEGAGGTLLTSEIY